MSQAGALSKRKQRQAKAMSRKIKQTRLTLSDLVIPLASGALLIVLSIVVFIPMVKAAFGYVEEMKEVNTKIEQMENLHKQLKSLDEIQMNEDVLVARQVIPKVLLVSNFVYYIDTLATEKSLTVGSLSSSDSLNAVSGPLSYRGDFDNVVAFLEDVQEISPYMIRLESVKVSIREDTDSFEETWSISLNVSGYHFSESGDKPDIYAPFQLYTEYEDIVQIFKKKAEAM